MKPAETGRDDGAAQLSHCLDFLSHLPHCDMMPTIDSVRRGMEGRRKEVGGPAVHCWRFQHVQFCLLSSIGSTGMDYSRAPALADYSRALVRPDTLAMVWLKPVLNWANVCSPNILRTVRRTMIRFLIELLVRRTLFGQSKLYFVLNWLVMRCKLWPELVVDAQQTT